MLARRVSCDTYCFINSKLNFLVFFLVSGEEEQGDKAVWPLSDSEGEIYGHDGFYGFPKYMRVKFKSENKRNARKHGKYSRGAEKTFHQAECKRKAAVLAFEEFKTQPSINEEVHLTHLVKIQQLTAEAASAKASAKEALKFYRDADYYWRLNVWFQKHKPGKIIIFYSYAFKFSCELFLQM